MKKSFLILLSSILAVFLITGCADDTTSNNGGSTGGTGSGEPIDIVVPEGTPTPIDLSTVEKYTTLQGTYEITFFYTDGGNVVVLTNDCTNAVNYGGTKACTNQTNEQVDMKGYGTISLDLQSQTGQIETKIQMFNDYMLTFPEIVGIKLSDQQYNYTKFTPIPVTAISATGINNNENAVTGTTGRNLTKNVTAPDSTYSFTVADDKLTLINTMVDKSNPIAANVTVRMKKISDEVVDLKANNPLTTPAITGFVANPQ